MSGSLFSNVNTIQSMIPEDQKKYNYTMTKNKTNYGKEIKLSAAIVKSTPIVG